MQIRKSNKDLNEMKSEGKTENPISEILMVQKEEVKYA